MALGFFKIKLGANLGGSTADPSSPVEGDMYQNTTNSIIRHYSSGAWRDVTYADRTQTLTNKSIDASTNTLTNIVNASISGSAAIAYSKLNLSASIVNADINASAAIVYSKLSLGNSILNADINTSAAIAYSKLNLSASIVNADVATGAAIARTKLASGSINQVIINDGSGVFSSEATLAKVRGGSGQDNSSLTFPASGTLATLAGTENFSNKTFTDKLALTEVASPATPASGVVIVYPKTDHKLYFKDSTGAERLVGSGSGTINYITNPDFESGTTGYATYSDGANAVPVDGTGGSPTHVTISASASSPLRGAQSLIIANSGSTSAQGEGTSFDFTIDSADKGKVLQVSFDYTVSSGTYLDGDLTVYLYDVTNALVIQPAGYTILSVASGINARQIATFQTSTTSTSYRLIWHVASTNTSAWNLKVDNVFVGPQIVEYGSAVTDWQAYTPTFGAGFGTVTSISMQSRRMGDSLQISGKFTLGTTSGSAATFTVGYGGGNANVTVDTTKIPTTALCGQLGRSANPSATLFNYSILSPSASGSSTMQTGVQTSSTSELTATTGASFTTGDVISVYCLIPITGWSSNVQMSNDTDTRVVAFSARSTATQSLTTATVTTITLGTTDEDTHGAWNSGTNTYTVAVPGLYEVTGQVSFTTNATNTREAFITVNGTIVAGSEQEGTSTANSSLPINYLKTLKSGDTIVLQGWQNSGGALTVTNSNASGNGTNLATFLRIKRLSGPSAIAATESVNARYHNSATAISGSLATVVWTTKDFDSHNAMSSGIYTIPVSGKYQVNCAIINGGTFALNNTVDVQIQKNNVAYTEQSVFAFASATDISITVGDIISCLAGDTIRVQLSSSATLPTISSSDTKNWFSIARVGN